MEESEALELMVTERLWWPCDLRIGCKVWKSKERAAFPVGIAARRILRFISGSERISGRFRTNRYRIPVAAAKAGGLEAAVHSEKEVRGRISRAFACRFPESSGFCSRSPGMVRSRSQVPAACGPVRRCTRDPAPAQHRSDFRGGSVHSADPRRCARRRTSQTALGAG